MADSLMLPVLGNDPAIRNTSNLEARLRQIDIQKGAFRFVTEQSLRDEIRKADAGVEDAHMGEDGEGDDDDDDDDTPESQQERVWQAREEMLKQLDRAKNDTLHALDFVSLLLSKHSVAARTSMSPFLQQAVPSGTLEGRVIKHVDPSLTSKRRFDAVSRGWKTKSFHAATEKLFVAGKRLEEEASSESSFWDQVALVKSRGWAVSRLPRDSRAIGVHFGFAEAAPRFRNQGFAILRRGDNGQLQMDGAANRSRSSCVQVAIFRNGKETGRSLPLQSPISGDRKIEDQITQARNALFEEELFYEAAREGRSIANQGVLVSAKTVKFDLEGDCCVHIELMNSEVVSTLSSQKDQALADFVSCALRVLLTSAHAQNLFKRSEPPQPLSLQPESTPEYVLLRPLISHLRHRSTRSSLQSWVSTVATPLKAAGLVFSMNSSMSSSLGNKVSNIGSKDLLDLLLGPADSSLGFVLPTKRELKLTIHTHVNTQQYGTEYTIAPVVYDFATLRPPRMTSIVDVHNFICHALTADILALSESTSVLETSDGANNTTSNAGLPTWKVTKPHSGEMILETPGNAFVIASVRVEQGKLGVKIQDHQTANFTKKTRLIWEGVHFSRLPADNRQEPEQRLTEILREFVTTRKEQSSDDSNQTNTLE